MLLRINQMMSINLQDQMKETKEEMELSVTSYGSAAERWKYKTKRPLISKIVKRDIGDFALILCEDPSKPFRFLYMKLLIGKNSVENLKKISMRIQRLPHRDEIKFQEMTIEMRKAGSSIASILKQLKVLRKKLESYGQDHITIIKLALDYDIVDPILILALRAVAFSRQLKISNALNCASAISLNQVQKIMSQFSSQKLPQSSCINRFICFEDLTEIDCQYFKELGIMIQNEASNYQELSDPYFINFEEQVMVEKLFSLL